MTDHAEKMDFRVLLTIEVLVSTIICSALLGWPISTVSPSFILYQFCLTDLSACKPRSSSVYNCCLWLRGLGNRHLYSLLIRKSGPRDFTSHPEAHPGPHFVPCLSLAFYLNSASDINPPSLLGLDLRCAL